MFVITLEHRTTKFRTRAVVGCEDVASGLVEWGNTANASFSTSAIREISTEVAEKIASARTKAESAFIQDCMEEFADALFVESAWAPGS